MSSRLVCINSRKIPEGSGNKGDDYTIELGKKIIACKGECIKASLQEFTMPKVWTDVNANNNKLNFNFHASEDTDWGAINYSPTINISPPGGATNYTGASVSEPVISCATIGGSGTGAVFDVETGLDEILNITTTSGGTGYKVGDKLTITAATLLSNGVDCVITLTPSHFDPDITGKLLVAALPVVEWVEQTSSVSSGRWYGIASSGTGEYLVATTDATSAGIIYRSEDYGIAWTPIMSGLPSTAEWKAIASSDDGEYIVAAGNDGVYYSTDGGTDWTQSGVPVPCVGVAISPDGAIMLSGSITANSFIYRSINGGSWSTVGSITGQWKAFAMSDDGTVLAACQKPGLIFVSSNSGADWTPCTANNSDTTTDWNDITSSADGTKLAAVHETGSIWTSSDKGLTWTENNIEGVPHDWHQITSSSDGTRLAATVFAGTGAIGIWVSVNSGLTWNHSKTTSDWSGIAMSSNGLKLAACELGVGGLGGNVWTGTNSTPSIVVANTTTGTGDIYIRPANYGSVHDLAASFGAAIGNKVVSECRDAYTAADIFSAPTQVNNWRFYGGIGLVAEPVRAAVATSPPPAGTYTKNPGLTGIRSGSSLAADQSDIWTGDTGYIPGSYPQITPHSLTTISGTTDNIISFTICFNTAAGELVEMVDAPLLTGFGLWCDPSDGDSAQLLGCDNGAENFIYVNPVPVRSTGVPSSAMNGLQVICKYPAVRFTSPNIYIRSNLAGETLSNNAFSQQIGDDESNKMNETDIIGICNVNTEILHTRNTDFRFRIDSDQVSKIRIYVTDEQGRPIGRARDSTLKTATTNTKAPFSSTQPAYPDAGTAGKTDFLWPKEWVDSGLPTTQLPDNSFGTRQSTLGNLNFQATIRFDIEREDDDYNKCG